MKYSIAYLKVFLSFTFVFISLISSAQEPTSSKQLQNEWKFESAAVEGSQVSASLDFYNSYFKFYDQVEFYNDSISLTMEDETLSIPYEVSDNIIGADFFGKSILAEWAIYDDKLYLEFNTYYLDIELKNVKLLLVYTSR